MDTDKCDVKLLGFWASHFGMRPRIVLNIKSVDYEFLEQNFVAKSELLLASNPVHKKIPVLIHRGKPICESLLILEYIDESWPAGPSILPSDPYDRATARFWAAYIDDKWVPALRGVLVAPTDETRKEATEKVMEILAVLEEVFIKCSKGNAFFSGNRIGFVDIALGCFLGWVRVNEKLYGLSLIDPSKTPQLAEWAESFCSDPAVKNVMPETDKLVEFSEFLIPILQASTPQ